MYSFSRNCAASVPVSTFMCLWVSLSDLYIPRIGPHISCSSIGRQIVGIYKSLTDAHECQNWDWGRSILFLGIFVSNFQFWFFAVCKGLYHIQSCQPIVLTAFHTNPYKAFSYTVFSSQFLFDKLLEVYTKPTFIPQVFSRIYCLYTRDGWPSLRGMGSYGVEGWVAKLRVRGG